VHSRSDHVSDRVCFARFRGFSFAVGDYESNREGDFFSLFDEEEEDEDERRRGFRRRRIHGGGDEKSGHDIARVSTHPREREWFYHQSFVFRRRVKTTNNEHDSYVLEVLSRAT